MHLGPLRFATYSSYAKEADSQEFGLKDKHCEHKPVIAKDPTTKHRSQKQTVADSGGRTQPGTILVRNLFENEANFALLPQSKKTEKGRCLWRTRLNLAPALS